MPPDTILCRPVRGKTGFCICLCYPVLLGAKQFVGKMSAKLVPLFLAGYQVITLCGVVWHHGQGKEVSVGGTRSAGVCLPVPALPDS